MMLRNIARRVNVFPRIYARPQLSFINRATAALVCPYSKRYYTTSVSSQIKWELKDNTSPTPSAEADPSQMVLLVGFEEGSKSEENQFIDDLIEGRNSNVLDGLGVYGMHFRDAFGNSPLHITVAGGNVETVKLLLAHGADINAKNTHGLTPIFLLFRNQSASGALDVYNFLVENGAKLDVTDIGGRTIVHYTAWNDATDVFHSLINKYKLEVDSRDVLGHTPLHIAASYKMGKNMIEKLIEAGANINAEDNDGRTPLTLAITHGCTECWEVLLLRGAVIKDELVYAKSAEAVDTLVKHGAPLNSSSLGTIPLVAQMHRHNLEAIKALLKHGADVNLRDPSYGTPLAATTYSLFLTCKNTPSATDHILPTFAAIISSLLEAGADINAATRGGMSPLHVLSGVPSHPLITSLLPSLIPAGGVNQQMDSGQTPLFIAAAGGNLEGVQKLVELGAKYDKEDFESDFSPIRIAEVNGHSNVVEWLVSAQK